MQGVQTESRHRGIGRYTQALTAAFARVAAGHELGLMFNAALDGVDEAVAALSAQGLSLPRMTYGPVRGTSFDNPANRTRRDAAERVLTHALDASGADVVWLTSVVEGFSDDALAPHGQATPLTVATLYDLIPLHDPSTYLGNSHARDWYMHRIEALKRCDLLLAISAWVRDDAVARLGIEPERIVAIGAGVDARFAPPAHGINHSATLRDRFSIDRPFMLYNGGIEKRKKVDVLFPAFGALPPALRDTHQLVVVGRMPPETRQRFDKLVQEAGLRAQDVIFTGFVSDEDLVALYQACALFVFPSEREGFGLPPLEAMACGAPVIANHATSLPEVVGDPGALFDAARPQLITQAMQAVLADPQRQRQLRELGLRRAAEFTWARVAERALAAIEQARSSAHARVAAPDAALPTYQFNADNFAERLPELRRWPGQVQWSGAVPAPGSMSPADRYRVHGYAGLCLLEQPEDWRTLLLRDATGWHDGGEQTANPLLARQRRVEQDIATKLAADLSDNDLAAIADALDRLRPCQPHRWLVDVTHIAGKDLGTGIQRVVRSILGHWLSAPPAGIRIEPIAFRDGRYHHAHAYACGLLGIADPGDLPDDIVAITGNESFIGLDWAMESLPPGAPLLRTWRRAGVSMHFVMNDILPETLPDAFHQRTREQFRLWLDTVAELADAVHCISRTTADEFRRWLQANHPACTPRIDHFPLGVEPRRGTRTAPLTAALDEAMRARPSVLMVGTLEPRKAHAQALKAVELLWEASADLNLVLVGHRGWLVGDLIKRLERHEALNSRLFWLENASDAVLEAIYERATVLLATSHGEGYGLPLIEAAVRNMPIIARDLPVFREVAGDYPHYFDGKTPEALATILSRWLASRPPGGAAPAWKPWSASAALLAEAIRRQA